MDMFCIGYNSVVFFALPLFCKQYLHIYKLEKNREEAVGMMQKMFGTQKRRCTFCTPPFLVS